MRLTGRSPALVHLGVQANGTRSSPPARAAEETSKICRDPAIEDDCWKLLDTLAIIPFLAEFYGAALPTEKNAYQNPDPGDPRTFEEQMNDTRSDDWQGMTLEQLQALRRSSAKISEYMLQQTETYLEALRPALSPPRLLGEHIEHPGVTNAPNADRAWAQLVTKYKEVATKPFSIPRELRPPLRPIDVNVVLYPWEYRYRCKSPDGPRMVTVRCPAKWIVTYRSSYTLSQLREALEAGQANKERTQEFILNALIMREMLQSTPGLNALLSALRLELGEETSPETGGLPFATLTAAISSRLPKDDIVVQATEFTGVHEFTELVDPESVKVLTDPVRERLQELIEPITG